MPVLQRRNNSACPYGRAVVRARGVDLRLRPPTPREHVLLIYTCPCGNHQYRFITHRSMLMDRQNNELIGHAGGRFRRMENLEEGESSGEKSYVEEEFVER